MGRSRGVQAHKKTKSKKFVDTDENGSTQISAILQRKRQQIAEIRKKKLENEKHENIKTTKNKKKYEQRTRTEKLPNKKKRKR